MGASRPPRTITSNTASSAAESEEPSWITGLMSGSKPSKAGASIRGSCARIQLTLPLRVLISPLWASIRNGWARCQVGNVLVE